MTVLAADWDAPSHVTAFTTARGGGVSAAPYDSLNLGAFVGDEAEHVNQNRLLVRETQGWIKEPLWLRQVHGTTIVRAEDLHSDETAVPEADGAVTESGQALAVLTADCLPVVACDRKGTVVGAFHAGWKGLLAGVLEAGLAAMKRHPDEILVWVGPGIGVESYQVGADVRNSFLASNPAHEEDFIDDTPGHWKFDLSGAAVRRLALAGVGAVTRSRWDTLRDSDLFFSHRRGAPTGRMATFIVLNPRSLS